jgi:hypothetical protein
MQRKSTAVRAFLLCFSAAMAAPAKFQPLKWGQSLFSASNAPGHCRPVWLWVRERRCFHQRHDPGHVRSGSCLSETAEDTTHIVCVWSLRIVSRALFRLDERDLGPFIDPVSWLDGRCRFGALWPAKRAGGGKSGLHESRVAANGRRGRPQGKCHRKQTACGLVPTARVKRCGKSAPRFR